MGSSDSRRASLTVGRGQVGPLHPRTPALSREVIEIRHPPLQCGHCCRRAFTHRHHRRGRAPAPAPLPRGPLPPAPSRARLSFPSHLSAHSSRKCSTGRLPRTLTRALPSGKCSFGEGAVAYRACCENPPSCTIAGEKETRAPGPPRLTLVHTFSALSAHSPNLNTHTPSPKPLSAQDAPLSRASASWLAPLPGLAVTKRLLSPVDRIG